MLVAGWRAGGRASWWEGVLCCAAPACVCTALHAPAAAVLSRRQASATAVTEWWGSAALPRVGLQGEIERTEEMLPGFEDLAGGKKSGKRKADDEGAAAAPSQAGAAPAAEAPAGAAAAEGGAAAAAAPGGEKKKRKQQEGADGGGGAAGEGDKPPAKKKKKVVPEAMGGAAAPSAAGAAAPAPAAGLSIAQLAVMAARGVLPGVNIPAATPAPAGAPAAAPVAASPAAQPQPSGSQAPPPSAKKRGAAAAGAAGTALKCQPQCSIPQCLLPAIRSVHPILARLCCLTACA